MPEIRQGIGLAPSETLAAFDLRDELVQSVRWSELMNADHAFGFTMAKLHKLELLAKVRDAVRSMIADGGTPDRIIKGLVPELQKAGWWGVVTNAELTGTNEPVVINENRLRNMLRTNLRVSRAAGQWSRIQALKRLAPYLAYYAIDDDVTRPEHRIWGGLDGGKPIVLPVDHPFWLTHYPPNGWGCRCRPRQYSSDDLISRELSVTSDDTLKAMGLMASDGTIAPPEFTFSAANGEDYDIPSGIDPGFAYNAGIATLRAATYRATQVIEANAIDNFDAAQTVLGEIIASPAFDLFLREPQNAFPVALLNPSWQERLSAPSPLVTLPNRVYLKQLKNHPDLALADYRALPEIVEGAVSVIAQGGDKLIFFKDRSGRLMKAVIRYDKSERLPYVVSFHFAQTREIAREAKKGTLLFSAGDTLS